MNGHISENLKRHDNSIVHVAADFVCFVCGAVFTTDEDRKHHLEKEAHGKLRDNITEEERKRALEQEKSIEDHIHHV